MLITLLGGYSVVADAQPRVYVRYADAPTLATEQTGGREVAVDNFQLQQFGYLPGELSDDDYDGVPNLDDHCPDTTHDDVHNPADNISIDECGCVVESERLPPAEVQRRLAALITSDTINFEFDQSRLTPNALALLRDYLTRVRGKPISVLVEGHADSIGSDSYNQALSQRRANAVLSWLQQRGINAELVKTVGYGERRPAVPGNSVDSRMQNRRVELTIKAEADGLSNFNLPTFGNVGNFLQLDCAEAQTGLNANGRRMMNKLAAFLLISPATRLTITGHVYEDAIAPKVAALVARRRAQEVRRYLLEIGVPPYQVEPGVSAAELPKKNSAVAAKSCVTMELQR